MSINVAIIGSTGYTGTELVKILIDHPKVNLKSLSSEKNYGKYLYDIFPHSYLKNLPKLEKNRDIDITNLDLVYIALPHVESQKYIKNIIGKVRIIDLSADFRLKNSLEYEKWYQNKHILKEIIPNFTYGLCEIYKENISKSVNISVPGCYPTSVLLPLIPILKSQLIKSKKIIIDSKSGYSGAGRNFNLKLLINDNQLNSYNYNTNNHRHMPEIEQELSIITKNKVDIIFNPHILPIERGIISSIYCNLEDNIKISHIEDCLINFYKNHKFIEIKNNKNETSLFEVIGTNKCIIKVVKNVINNTVVIQSFIDNLIKGASGQAVQNMNIMMGYNEDQALTLNPLVLR